MKYQLSMNLHNHQYVTADCEDREALHLALEEDLTSRGYPVGVRDIEDLPEEGFAEARSNTFGASDSAVLLGVAYSSAKVPMKTIAKLVDEKVNKEWNTEIGKLPAVRKGKEQESMIIDKVEKRWNLLILKPKHMYIDGKGTAVNFDGVGFDHITDQDDEIIDDIQPIPVEIKSCSFFGRRNYNWDLGISEFSEDMYPLPKSVPNIPKHISATQRIITLSEFYGIPKYYYSQLQQQISYLNAPYGYLAVMDDINWTVYLYRVERDDITIKALFETAYFAKALMEKKRNDKRS